MFDGQGASKVMPTKLSDSSQGISRLFERKKDIQLLKYQTDFLRDDIEMVSMYQLCLKYNGEHCSMFR